MISEKMSGNHDTAYAQGSPLSCVSLPPKDAPSYAVDLPPVRCEAQAFEAASPVENSVMQRVAATVLDALIVFAACCIFFAIFQGFHASAPIDRFEEIMLTCAVMLIAAFYAFLFKMGGGDTVGQIWLRMGLLRAFDSRRNGLA